jgi:hypothetical protein
LQRRKSPIPYFDISQITYLFGIEHCPRNISLPGKRLFFTIFFLGCASAQMALAEKHKFVMHHQSKFFSKKSIY